MPKVSVNEDRCKGCGLCIAACPQKIMALGDWLNKKGYHPAHVLDAEKCKGCTLCAVMCPDVAITVER